MPILCGVMFLVLIGLFLVYVSNAKITTYYVLLWRVVDPGPAFVKREGVFEFRIHLAPVKGDPAFLEWEYAGSSQNLAETVAYAIALFKSRKAEFNWFKIHISSLGRDGASAQIAECLRAVVSEVMNSFAPNQPESVVYFPALEFFGLLAALSEVQIEFEDAA